ncbi:hypothetical protein DK254_08230 [Pseudomonas sp. RW407]|nr:hypothetical protein DK254_08230 [Pseudomonas sp. RW407]
MPSKEFIEGFRQELANRSFALITVRRMAARCRGSDWHMFWQAYWDLEILNARRYEAAALRWGLDPTPGLPTKLKAWIVSSVPRCLMVGLVKFVHGKTIAYVDRLRDLRQSGPAETVAFLDFMVEQEELQVEMMRLALAGRHSEMRACAEGFFLKHEGSTSRPGQGARQVSAS